MLGGVIRGQTMFSSYLELTETWSVPSFDSSGMANLWVSYFYGNLYLQDGVADHGERLLPEGFVDYASTVAPAWQSDGPPSTAARSCGCRK